MRPIETRKCGAHAALDQALASQQNDYFPHKNAMLKPEIRFFIGGKWLNLYTNTGRPPSSAFSLYWQDEQNPVQHAMNWLEVLNILSSYLKPFVNFLDFEREFAEKNGWACQINDCQIFSCVLGFSLEEVRKINAAGYTLTPGAWIVSSRTVDYIIAEKLGRVVCEKCRRELEP